MKKLFVSIAFLIYSISSFSQFSLQNLRDSASYFIGASIATTLKIKFDTLNSNALLLGYQHTFYNDSLVVNNFERNQVIEKYRLEEIRIKNAAIKANGESFLLENKKRPTVITTQSGLQYEILKLGKGKMPAIGKNVNVNYEMKHIDNTLIDKTEDLYLRIEEQYLLPGIFEGIQLCPEGSKVKFYIPYELGYGVDPKDVLIKPYEAIIVELEILKVLDLPKNEFNTTQ